MLVLEIIVAECILRLFSKILEVLSFKMRVFGICLYVTLNGFLYVN